MASDRMRRINEAMREVLSDATAQGLKDPRVGFVTVTDVDTSPDLRQATVYVSVLGTDAQQQATIDGLQSAHGFLQSQIARQLRLKRTPTLQFFHDETAKRAARLGAILDRDSA